MKSIRPSTSPNSVISKATIDGAISELRHVISKLHKSEVLEESEMVVIQIEQFWHEAYMDVDIKTMLSGNTVINGFMDILFNSVDPSCWKLQFFYCLRRGPKPKMWFKSIFDLQRPIFDFHRHSYILILILISNLFFLIAF